tara:strand:- start:366 stop:812 length:447 start_codon:yes stop_codon:yes gene_type:complete
MSRLEHVVSVGAALREAAPEATAGLFWMSKNEKAAKDYVDQYWWRYLADLNNDPSEKAKHAQHMVDEWVKLRRVMMQKESSPVHKFPTNWELTMVTAELVEARNPAVRTSEQNPKELEHIAQDLWAEIKKRVRGKPSMFDSYNEDDEE